MKKITAWLLLVCVILSFASCGAEKPATYSVTFDLNGGRIVNGEEAEQQVKEGGSAALPEVVREGYEFDGWDGEYENVTSSRLIVAKWTKLYTVTFDLGADDATARGETEIKVRKGDVPAAPTPTLKGAEFLGWDPEIVPADDDATYVATWSKRTYTAEQVFDIIAPGVAEIIVYDKNNEAFALGSGFFIDGDGTLVTNYHVMEGAYSATATLLSDSSVAYDIISVTDYDEDLDLAIVKVDIDANEFLTLSEDEPVTGETIYALGSSVGLTGTFSDGIVSTSSRMMGGVDFIQITAPISHGNSGGPLVNTHAEVLGVNALMNTEGQNLNFAININELKNLDSGKEGVTLSDFGGMTSSTAESVYSDQTGGWYDYVDKKEAEPNDSLNLADSLPVGEALAADVSSSEDFDVFYFRTDSEKEIQVDILPFYGEDYYTIAAAVYAITDDDYKEIGFLQIAADTDEDGEPVDYLELKFTSEADMTYVVLVFSNDDEDPSFPLYYAIGYSES